MCNVMCVKLNVNNVIIHKERLEIEEFKSSVLTSFICFKSFNFGSLIDRLLKQHFSEHFNFGLLHIYQLSVSSSAFHFKTNF